MLFSNFPSVFESKGGGVDGEFLPLLSTLVADFVSDAGELDGIFAISSSSFS